MVSASLIMEKDKIEDLAKEVQGNRNLPSCLFNEDKYKRVVVELKNGGELAGMAYGVVERRTDIFTLHDLFVKKEYRTKEAVVSLLGTVLKAAADAARAKSALWRYVMNESDKDKRADLLSGMEFCRVKDIKRLFRRTRIKTADFEYARKYKIYQPHLWKEKGYDVFRWDECDEGLKDIIREREKDKGREPDYLSPFIENIDEDWIPDKETSLLLVRKSGGTAHEPAGWMVCKKSDGKDREIFVYRFYIYAEERARMAGHSFISYAMDVFSITNEYVCFDVAIGNRQMERLVSNYLRPIVDSSQLVFGMEIAF